MKKAKKVISALCAMMMVSSLGVVHAASTDPITIDSVIFSEYTNSEGVVDEALIEANIGFTAVSEADQISLLLTSEDIKEITNENEGKIIYIDQVETPADGTIKFVIEKARVQAAIGSEQIDGTTLYAKMGGTNINTMASKTIVLEDPANAVMPGDVDGDGEVTSIDAVLTLRYEAGWNIANIIEAAMDVDGDDEATSMDAVLILRYEAGWDVELK